MICPIMSRPVLKCTFSDEQERFVTQATNFINCEKEDCALWVGNVVDPTGNIAEYGHCGLIKL